MAKVGHGPPQKKKYFSIMEITKIPKAFKEKYNLAHPTHSYSVYSLLTPVVTFPLAFL